MSRSIEETRWIRLVHTSVHSAGGLFATQLLRGAVCFPKKGPADWIGENTRYGENARGEPEALSEAGQMTYLTYSLPSMLPALHPGRDSCTSGTPWAR